MLLPSLPCRSDPAYVCCEESSCAGGHELLDSAVCEMLGGPRCCLRGSSQMSPALFLQAGAVAKEKAGQASDALEEGARQAADTAQKVAADTSEAIESGGQQVCTLVFKSSPCLKTALSM